jgi:lysophospholipase L1-like esterase
VARKFQKSLAPCLVALLAVFSAACASAQQVAKPRITYITPTQTLLIGDSITADFTDQPTRAGFPGQQACTIRYHLSTAMAQNPGIKRVVIEAGTNDIILGPFSGVDCNLPLQDPVSVIVDMVKTAQAAGMQVFVLSVLPISWNNQLGQPCDPLIPPFNATLQAAITAAGAYWVDDYDAFVGHPEYQIDGVHPNEAGYKVIEGVYFSTVCTDTGQC